MNKVERRRYIEYMVLRDELEEKKQSGYALALSGKEASIDEIAKVCIFQEGSSYMRDYVRGSSESSPMISFEPVRL